MRYEDMIEGQFVRRRNRFIAEVMIGEQVEAVHVRNTGRLKELFVEGVPVLLLPASNPERKTKYSLICVRKKGLWVNVDSTAPNQVVEEMVRRAVSFLILLISNGKKPLEIHDLIYIWNTEAGNIILK